MLAVLRAHGVDVALRSACEAGVVLTGGSAGSLAWFECGTTDSFHLDVLEPLHDGLGFLAGSHCPHYDGEVQRRPLYHKLIGDGFPAGIAVDEDAAVHYVGTEISEVVSARPGANGLPRGTGHRRTGGRDSPVRTYTGPGRPIAATPTSIRLRSSSAVQRDDDRTGWRAQSFGQILDSIDNLFLDKFPNLSSGRIPSKFHPID